MKNYVRIALSLAIAAGMVITSAGNALAQPIQLPQKTKLKTLKKGEKKTTDLKKARQGSPLSRCPRSQGKPSKRHRSQEEAWSGKERRQEHRGKGSKGTTQSGSKASGSKSSKKDLPQWRKNDKDKERRRPRSAVTLKRTARSSSPA